ncbi:hypothetical protein MESS2_990019 [Mesorhizobium metallidurans STM 2683]|uniref:Uncharacterized protein n=5 Tax=Mesorhizobium TaxID=68287 RepID=A0A1R3V7P4_9HYPH|nr:conserved hypothetical protein [Mesorhizobium ventifaucium]CAH2399197.1 conserved hypothetical protein [Mesorhizobium escarrei]CCV09379.1 hypothetical protein MESS2_990019 [Mesorhizobium metallidurans STM 2683]SIT55912.1 conserved hypothetical protein [Mesorhizobium prunaredense]SJM34703.1 conserved hypothetical protein [Mesorhizobium delmotii]
MLVLWEMTAEKRVSLPCKKGSKAYDRIRLVPVPIVDACLSSRRIGNESYSVSRSCEEPQA